MLKINSNRLGPEAIRALLSSPHLGELSQFDVSYNEIGAEGAKAILDSPKLQNLESLGAYSLGCGEEWESRLVEHFGDDVVSTG